MTEDMPSTVWSNGLSESIEHADDLVMAREHIFLSTDVQGDENSQLHTSGRSSTAAAAAACSISPLIFSLTAINAFPSRF